MDPQGLGVAPAAAFWRVVAAARDDAKDEPAEAAPADGAEAAAAGRGEARWLSAVHSQGRASGCACRGGQAG
jgi:hypothetical protein